MSDRGCRRLSLKFLWVKVGQSLSPYLDLPFSHDLVHNLVIVLVEHALVVALLVAQDPQVLGAFQLDFKLLLKVPDTENESQLFVTSEQQR